MKNREESTQFTKSPLIFLFLVGVLVISTLVVASDYFLRPQIEAELRKGSTQYYAVSSEQHAAKKKMHSNMIKK